MKGMSNIDIKMLEEREFNSNFEAVGQENLVINLMNILDIVPPKQSEDQRSL